MASKLCCTAEQEGRPGSPDLPNARLNAAAPHWPLLAKQADSPSSHFTSARSDELHELRQIFDNAQHGTSERASPRKAPRLRSSRPSIYSLHSLHKMTSMRSMLRRKFSKDLPRKKSSASVQRQAARRTNNEQAATVVKHPGEVLGQPLKVTKEDLRKDLLSDKKPAEGGYDSDAEILDVVARNLGRPSPSKRPSIHSVDWAPSSASKSTPGSTPQLRDSAERRDDLQPYQIEKPQPSSLSNRFAHVLSTPNLRAEGPHERQRELRRSHSATLMGLPKPSPLSPLRLPSLTDHDQNGIPWAEVMSESLRLSHFPIPPRHAGLKPSKTMLVSDPQPKDSISDNVTEHFRADNFEHDNNGTASSPSARTVEIRIQQPTSIASPRPSASVRRDCWENAPPVNRVSDEHSRNEDEEFDNHRRSVHLYSMRISHHLRSASLLSWDQLADAPELPSPPRPFRQRTMSDQSRVSQAHAQFNRHERKTSSSGFASNMVPSKWDKVLPTGHDARTDVASSIYSSRPQSPPDSFGGSMANLSQIGSGLQNFSQSLVDLSRLRRSNSFPTDNEETPRPLHRYGVTNLAATQNAMPSTSLLTGSPVLARKNSVADTKKSKFREEFSPSPPRKKLTPSASIMKFLNPKRLSLRSLSEANLRSEAPQLCLDGPFDTLAVPGERERPQSRSLISLQAEQEALGKEKSANGVWHKALKAHQEEKASMFLPKNKNLAVHASPFRERSGSFSGRRPSFQEDQDPVADASTVKRLSAPVFAPRFEERGSDERSVLVGRRSATAGRDVLSPAQEVAEAFEKQGDEADVVGAWGRYPSHTRAERTLSSGKKERVETRDFALEAAIRFASAQENDGDEYMIDPIDRLPSPTHAPGGKKRKKKIGTSKMAKSHSMTFGRKLIKNYYAGMFKSSSSEFRQHGRGHRSSIASGGTLEHPELELLPEVFMADAHDGARGDSSSPNNKQVTRRNSERQNESTSRDKLPGGVSMATLRPRRNSSAPNLHDLGSLHDGADDLANAQDRARVWSVYYENCVPSFPRLSTDNDISLGNFDGISRVSSNDKQIARDASVKPACHSRHSRNASLQSRMSRTSRRSGPPESSCSQEGSILGEEESIVSVRRSTMDLISMFKEQESTEHERVLSLTRAESRREAVHLTSL